MIETTSSRQDAPVPPTTPPHPGLRPLPDELAPRTTRRTRVGLVAGGLGAYWPQFPDLLPALTRSAEYVRGRLEQQRCDVVDVGFVSDAQEAAVAAERLRRADPDLIVLFLTTYLTASMVLPIAQRSQAPVLVIDLQPTEAMDHAGVDTGQWLAYCGQCSVPEVGNVFRRAGIEFRSVSGYLGSERAWSRILTWVAAAQVRARLRHARHGLMGHLYPGMLDVSTDLTLVSTQLGSHVEVLELDDLRVRVAAVTVTEVAERQEMTRQLFEIDETVEDEDFSWAARVSVGLDRLVADFDLDTLAYYHRGLEGEQHERLGAGLILGASLLTARGVPTAGEYELRTSIAQLVGEALGAGGSFTELQALNFRDDVVEMGHDGPAHLRIGAARPLLRGLGVYHGKRGWGVSAQLNAVPGPVTTLGLGQDRDGSFVLVVSEGESVPGPMLDIGNSTSRIAFGMDPGEWVDRWSATGVGHHWALGVGHLGAQVAAAANLLGLECRQV